MMHTRTSWIHCWIALVAMLYCTPASAQPLVETNPAVRAALELPREQPADYLRTVLWLVDLGRPALAKPIMDELVQLPMTDAERAALVAQFGSRDMLRLARVRELVPAGVDFADACMAAAAAAATDPQRIDALVSQLTDPSPEVRQFARSDLAATGWAGVRAAIEAFARETNVDRRAALAVAVEQMAPLSVGPLLAMLETDDEGLRAIAAELLRRLRVPQAAPLLLSGSAAERALVDALGRTTEGNPPFPLDERNQVELWHWSDDTRQLTSASYRTNEARVIWQARLAGRLSDLRPEHRDYLRQSLVLELEAAPLISTNHRQAAQQRLSSADTQLVNDVLFDALRGDDDFAAAAAADTLGERGDPGVLHTSDARPSPLAAALAHADRGVRFAAVRAIMTIDPPTAYAGASLVPEALNWFATSGEERQVVVAMPTHGAATNLAGILIGQGFASQATNRGRELVDTARQLADLEMIFVDMDLIAPDIRQVLYELRTLPTTARIPIALMAADGRLEAARRLASEHDRVLAVSRPHSAEVVHRIVQRLAELAGRDAAPVDERAVQGELARGWIETLRDGGRPFYTLRQSAPRNHPDSIEPPGRSRDPALEP